MTKIDWRRIAEPQPDGYDADVALAFAAREGYQRLVRPGAPTCFDGAVVLFEESSSFVLGTAPARPDHPNIARACELIRLWPEGFQQCQRLLDCLEIFVELNDNEDRVLGSACHFGARGFGHIKATVNNHVGFAESIVHEMAHHKLRAIGIEFEGAERLIANPQDALYPSPIRYDTLRPMTAVLHAQFSYCHVAALDIVICEAALDHARDLVVAHGGLAPLLPKLAFGRRTIGESVQTDDDGAAFIAGFQDWTGRVLDRGFAVLENLGVDPVPFEHPQQREGGPVAREIEQALGYLPYRPRRRDDVHCHEVRNEMVLFCPVHGAAYALNPSSRSVWELCDGGLTVGEIAERLLAGLGSEDTALLRALLPDVAAAVRHFGENGLLQTTRPEAPE